MNRNPFFRDRFTHSPSSIEAPVYYCTNVAPRSIQEDVMAGIFRTLAAPKIHERVQVPRHSLLITPGDSVVFVGTPNTKRVHQIQEYVGSEGEVLFVEPLPDNNERLEREASQYDNVVVDPRAAGTKSTTMEMSIGPVGENKQVIHDLEAHGLDNPETEEIAVERLDKIVAEHSFDPDFTEIAVGGVEADVLRGFSDTLSEISPRLFVKAFGYDPSEDPYRCDRIGVLEENGYRTVRAPSRTPPPHGGCPDGDIFAWK